MTIDELRTALEALPERFDHLEVMVLAGRGLCHPTELILDRAKGRLDHWDRLPDLTPDRLARKLRISAGLIGSTLWSQPPPDWRLVGPWPPELANLGVGPQ